MRTLTLAALLMRIINQHNIYDLSTLYTLDVAHESDPSSDNVIPQDHGLTLSHYAHLKVSLAAG